MMEPMALYVVKSVGLLSAFWLAYQLLLRKETFFQANRWYLLAGLAASVCLPLLTITKTILVPAMPLVPVSDVTYVASDETNTIDWMQILFSVYLLGIGWFAIKFLRNLWALARIIRGGSTRDGLRYIDTTLNVAPFSFMNAIVYNSSHYNTDELCGILAHERAHCRQKHSVDVILAHLYCIAFWFNPLAWLYKKTVMQNLEFIADHQATKLLSDKKPYQFALLKVASNEALPISNPFHQSLIKKRIVMLNKSQSNQLNSVKYLAVVPLVILFILFFQVKVVAQEVAVSKPNAKTQVVIDKNTSDAQLKAEAERIKNEHGVKLKFSKVKRNQSGEITAIKADYKAANGTKGSTQINSATPIVPLSFFVKPDGKMGFGQGRVMSVASMRNFGPQDVKIEIPELDLDIPEIPMADIHPEVSKVLIKKAGQKPMIIVNGQPIEIEDAEIDLEGKSFAFSFNGEDHVIINGEAMDAAKGREIARLAMERAKPKIEQAHKKMEDAHKKMEEGFARRAEAMAERQEALAHVKADHVQMKAELEKARAELEKARTELARERADLEKAREKK
jgi:hypothetical protein